MRARELVGPDGRATAVNELPALADVKRPSQNAASSSADPPLGWTLISILLKNPPLVFVIFNHYCPVQHLLARCKLRKTSHK